MPVSAFYGSAGSVPQRKCTPRYFSAWGLTQTEPVFYSGDFVGVAYELKRVCKLMRLSPLQIVSMGGGSKSDVWNQIKADVLGVSVAMPHTGRPLRSALPFLGSIACGIFPTISAPVKSSKQKRIFPTGIWQTRTPKGYATYKSMYNSFYRFV